MANAQGEVSSCDIAYKPSLEDFNTDYLKLTRRVADTCIDYDLSANHMVIGTSAIIDTELDGAIGMYSGIFNNPFLIWCRFKMWKAPLQVQWFPQVFSLSSSDKGIC